MFNFPTSPTNGETYSPSGGPQYIYNSTSGTWNITSDVTYAAPLDALAYSGMQINGSMEVSQEYGATPITVSAYLIDGFSFYNLVSGASVSAAQVTDAPPGLTNSIKIIVTTAKSSLATTDEIGIAHSIEGYRVARLAWGTASALPISIGFWCKTHRTGTYSGAVGNAAYNRTYAFTWTQNVIDTWEYKTATIPGDTTGTWLKNNDVGVAIQFLIAGGTNTITAPNVWTATGKDGATGQVNGIAATTDTYQITGVVILPGIYAPTAAQSPLIMRPYDQELVTCQRYLQFNIWGDAACSSIAGNYGTTVTFPILMRAVPTLSSGTGSTNTNAGVTTIDGVTAKKLRFYGLVAANTAYEVLCDVKMDARL